MARTAPDPAAIAVSLELGRRRAFAWALDWPGWCRAGRDGESAMAALAAYAARYAPVADLAGLRFAPAAAQRLAVAERLEGSTSTDFGVPGAIGADDRRPLEPAEASRRVSLVESAWRLLNRTVAGAPEVLRKGPRGGGRDRDAIARHVVDAEAAYARKLGARLSAPDPGDPESLAAFRAALASALLDAAAGGAGAWPARYAARRIAWHALDHAWEIEDRSSPDG